MSKDVVTRLAAANPVPHDGPLPTRAILSGPPRPLAVAVAVASRCRPPPLPGKLGDLLGISNDGTPVPVSSVLPGETKLDQALEDMNLGATMQFLGTLNGVSFYAARNADGNFCVAIVRVDVVPEGFGAT